MFTPMTLCRLFNLTANFIKAGPPCLAILQNPIALAKCLLQNYQVKLQGKKSNLLNPMSMLAIFGKSPIRGKSTQKKIMFRAYGASVCAQEPLKCTATQAIYTKKA